MYQHAALYQREGSWSVRCAESKAVHDKPMCVSGVDSQKNVVEGVVWRVQAVLVFFARRVRSLVIIELMNVTID